MGPHLHGGEVPYATPTATEVILLDTNALIWLLSNHPRSKPLARLPRLYVSPASLLELDLLVESGRGRLVPGRSIADIADEPRWLQDEPPAGQWFHLAMETTWTRDPFDRLIVAHARVRGWKLATGDALLIEHLAAREVVAL